jgi:hypothetical protein
MDWNGDDLDFEWSVRDGGGSGGKFEGFNSTRPTLNAGVD